MEKQAEYQAKAGADTGTGNTHREFNQLLIKLETMAGLIGSKEIEGRR